MDISKDAEKAFMMQYYVVAFVDLIGQQEALKQFNGLPNQDDPEQMKEFFAAAKDTFGVVRQFRRCFAKYFSSYMQHSPEPEGLSEEDKKIYAKMKGNTPKFQSFSDFFVIFVPLSDNINKLPVEGVYATIGACASTFLLMLSAVHLMRGAIEIGLGAEMYEDELYGPVVSEVYSLESKVAQYPRIIVGPELCNYLGLKLQIKEDDHYAKAERVMAETCNGMLTRDIDGVPFIDYLGEGYRSAIGSTLEKDIPEKAYNFLLEQSQKAKEKNNTTLAIRFNMIRQYFEARLPDWPEDSASTD